MPGTSPQTVLDKIFASEFLKRMQNWVERSGVLSESQVGFRSGYSTVYSGTWAFVWDRTTKSKNLVFCNEHEVNEGAYLSPLSFPYLLMILN